MRYSLLLALLTAGGCVSQQQHGAVEHQLSRALSERDDALRRLDNERARTTAFDENLRTEQAAHRTTRGELERSRSQTVGAKSDLAQVIKLMEDQAAGKLRRPEVVAVQLPEALDQALIRFASRFQKLATYNRTSGAIAFANDLLFDPGSDIVRDESKTGLIEFAKIVARPEAQGYEAVIVGHTDDRPITRDPTLSKHPSNWHLSVHRAIAVRDVLAKAGVPNERLSVMGYASYRPISEDRTRNRRVEIYLAPRGDVGPRG